MNATGARKGAVTWVVAVIFAALFLLIIYMLAQQVWQAGGNVPPFGLGQV